jgi:hypothetical protein
VKAETYHAGVYAAKGAGYRLRVLNLVGMTPDDAGLSRVFERPHLAVMELVNFLANPLRLGRCKAPETEKGRAVVEVILSRNRALRWEVSVLGAPMEPLPSFATATEAARAAVSVLERANL